MFQDFIDIVNNLLVKEAVTSWELVLNKVFLVIARLAYVVNLVVDGLLFLKNLLFKNYWSSWHFMFCISDIDYLNYLGKCLPFPDAFVYQSYLM